MYKWAVLSIEVFFVFKHTLFQFLFWSHFNHLLRNSWVCEIWNNRTKLPLFFVVHRWCCSSVSNSGLSQLNVRVEEGSICSKKPVARIPDLACLSLMDAVSVKMSLGVQIMVSHLFMETKVLHTHRLKTNFMKKGIEYSGDKRRKEMCFFYIFLLVRSKYRCL